MYYLSAQSSERLKFWEGRRRADQEPGSEVGRAGPFVKLRTGNAGG